MRIPTIPYPVERYGRFFCSTCPDSFDYKFGYLRHYAEKHLISRVKNKSKGTIMTEHINQTFKKLSEELAGLDIPSDFGTERHYRELKETVFQAHKSYKLLQKTLRGE